MWGGGGSIKRGHLSRAKSDKGEATRALAAPPPRFTPSPPARAPVTPPHARARAPRAPVGRVWGAAEACGPGCRYADARRDEEEDEQPPALSPAPSSLYSPTLATVSSTPKWSQHSATTWPSSRAREPAITVSRHACVRDFSERHAAHGRGEEQGLRVEHAEAGGHGHAHGLVWSVFWGRGGAREAGRGPERRLQKVRARVAR